MKFKRLDLTERQREVLIEILYFELKSRKDQERHAHSHGTANYFDSDIEFIQMILNAIHSASVIETPDD